MKYHQILTTLTAEPLLVVPATAVSLLELFHQHANLSPEAFRMAREGTGVCGEKVELEQMEIIDGVAHIPIAGPIGRGLSGFEKGAGAVDAADITDELDQAEESEEVNVILLDIDSP